MDKTYELFEMLKKERGVSNYQVAKDTGIAQTTLSDWKNGRIKVSMKVASRLSEYFGVPLELFTEKGINAPESSTDHSHWVPVLGRVAAGIPAEMIEDVLGYKEIDDAIGEAFALRINGDSMAPTLMKGDIVIVKKQEDVESGDVAIVAVNGEDATCKRIIKSSDGVMLVPINPEYPPIHYSNDEIINTPITILGKVIELRRSL